MMPSRTRMGILAVRLVEPLETHRRNHITGSPPTLGTPMGNINNQGYMPRLQHMRRRLREWNNGYQTLTTP